METKVCIKCDKEKSLEDFTKSAKSPDGRGSYCKECHKAYTKQWQKDHPEKVKATAKGSRDRNKDKHTAKRRKDRAEKPEVFLKYSRDFAEKNPEKLLLYEARKRAKDFGLPITITEEDIIIPEFCPIFGVRLVRGSIDNNRDSCPSLDRINPEIGYIPGNIAVISYRANRIKNNGTSDEHRRIADWMDAHKINWGKPGDLTEVEGVVWTTKEIFKKACEEVDSWEDWQRSLDPHGKQGAA